MQIKKVSLKDFSDAFNKSYDIGTKHYFFFILLGMIDVLFNTIIESSLMHSVVASLFVAGIISIAQTTVDENKTPSLSQYFTAFTNGSVLKKLKSFVIFNALITLLMGYAAGFLLVNSNDFLEQTILPSSPLIMFSVVFIISLLFMPFLMTPYILVLQDFSWSRSFGISFDGFKRNILIYFVAFMIPFPLVALMDPELYNLIDKPMTSILKILYCFISPFFVLFYYNLYKKLFMFDKADLKVN